MRNVALILVLLPLLGCTDSLSEKKILGSWRKNPATNDGVVSESMLTFLPDKKMTWSLTEKWVSNDADKEVTTVEGSWNVKDGFLHYKLDGKSGCPLVVPFETTNKIVTVTDTELTYSSGNTAQIYVWHRVSQGDRRNRCWCQ